jgi:hypothetical protein
MGGPGGEGLRRPEPRRHAGTNERRIAVDRERAERLAARRNARLRARHPLFADQLEEVTAEKVLREFEGYERRMAECRTLLAARAAEYKARVSELVTPEEFAALEERRKVLPDGEEYTADFWHRQVMSLDERGGTP